MVAGGGHRNDPDDPEIKISGYVWEDIPGSNKVTQRNDKYKDGTSDDRDVKVEGITVYLKEGNTTIATDTTDSNGAYSFTGDSIELDELESGSYHIEFEYNGLVYTNVSTAYKNSNNGSKAAETASNREEFNKQFTSIEGEEQYTGISLDEEGNNTYDITYEKGDEYNSINAEVSPEPVIIASTSSVYNLKDSLPSNYSNLSVIEIKNINLGIYRREQPDLRVASDIQSVKVVANGKNHVYEYAKRKLDEGQETSYGVEYESKYLYDVYEAPIYRADVTSALNVDNYEFAVYVTYCLEVSNQSSVLQSKVNSIINYFDSRYEVEKIGKSYKNGEIAGETIAIPESEQYGDTGYDKIAIPTNMTVEKESTNRIYVTFKLSADAIDVAFERTEEDARLFRSIGEINSYSSYLDGKVYAGIDEDSNPANAVPGDRETYEDDTFAAPAFKLKEANARIANGTVFKDQITDESQSNNERLGDGEYDDAPVKGVKVILKETTPGVEVQAQETYTDEHGYYSFKDFPAGNYQVEFDWGIDQGGLEVQNYKGTIYKAGGEDNSMWHLQEATRFSDALDNMETRRQIDEEMATVNYDNWSKSKSDFDNKVMDSSTPDMNIGIEDKQETITYAQDDGTIAINEYSVNNIDFGIVERPIQDLRIDKRVSHVKITLANGQVIIDAESVKDESGNVTLQGQKDHLTYLAPNPSSSEEQDKYGLVRAELDNEIIQGATLEVQYEITLENKSEKDYEETEYYLYGTGGTNLLKMRASKVADYLDSEWGVNEGSPNDGWDLLDKLADKAKIVLANRGRSFIYELLGVDAGEGDVNISNIMQRNILEYEDAKSIAPEESTAIQKLTVSKELTTGEDIVLNNSSEIVEITRPGESSSGSGATKIVYGRIPKALESHDSETTDVTPSTGENRDYTLPIILGTTALLITAVGIVLIKKKVLK